MSWPRIISYAVAATILEKEIYPFQKSKVRENDIISAKHLR